MGIKLLVFTAAFQIKYKLLSQIKFAIIFNYWKYLKKFWKKNRKKYVIPFNRSLLFIFMEYNYPEILTDLLGIQTLKEKTTKLGIKL